MNLLNVLILGGLGYFAYNQFKKPVDKAVDKIDSNSNSLENQFKNLKFIKEKGDDFLNNVEHPFVYIYNKNNEDSIKLLKVLNEDSSLPVNITKFAIECSDQFSNCKDKNAYGFLTFDSNGNRFNFVNGDLYDLSYDEYGDKINQYSDIENNLDKLFFYAKEFTNGKMFVKEANENNYFKLLGEAKGKPKGERSMVLAKSEGCQPCVKTSYQLYRFLEENSDENLNVFSVDVDKFPLFKQEYAVDITPTFFIFDDGYIVNETDGSFSTWKDLEKWIFDKESYAE